MLGNTAVTAAVFKIGSIEQVPAELIGNRWRSDPTEYFVRYWDVPWW